MIVGVIATLFVLFCASVLRLFFTRFSNRSFANVVPYLRPDGEDMLQELMDPSLERFLAHSLGHKQFREQQLDRIRLADEYFDHRRHNAIVCQGWGDAELRNARERGDEDMKAAADALVVACAEFRIGASAAQFQLHMWQFKLILLPFARLPRISRLRKLDYFDVFESYDKLRESALALATLCGADYYQRLLDAI
jgi:hypothetical protein